MRNSPNIYKLKGLPQVNAPVSFVLNELNNLGQPFEMLGVDVESIKPSQAFIDTDKVLSMMDTMKNGEDHKAIWLDKDNNSIDGNHRFASHKLSGNKQVPSIRILADKKTVIDLLNNIQAMYDQESSSEFLNVMKEEDDSMYVPEKRYNTKKDKLKGYKKTPIVPNSISGNFFSLNHIDKYKPYEISFSSLLDTDVINPSIGKDSNPTMALAKLWFPNLDFNKKATEMEMKLQDFINTIVAEKARTKKIDGIKYGTNLIQTIDDKRGNNKIST